ncbi:beta-glucanase (GH16 family) [Novosphingobium hassiacum]|uniref:Beta-glucanase (GH16 family) n=1 Tax=Novosphingobium hassiacum TaxID=173676 RepID=A0A7W6EUX9_9SPHN|nr:glycoside hydrolase family 16 protein [Novosphingobium hassiacum]MBB3859606.1 beta-glucanase (GH16 family) [Novosphingobium hassiacum]
MNALLLALSAATAATPLPPPAPAPGWSLVWSDEFDGSTIDAKRWTLASDCWGGGNAEQQCYTDRPTNAAVKDGLLVITAREETFTGPAFPADQRSAPDKRGTATRPFTSARLTTQGKAAWRYGRIEVRARLPQGQGMWPAIWMLPEDNRYGAWAASGEIDIMEAVNLGEPCTKGVPGCPTGLERGILGTLHFGGTWPANEHRGMTAAMPGSLDGFHDYAVEWSPKAITWFIDDKPFQTQRPGDWSTLGSDKPVAPFDQRFHLVLNLAVGGRLAEDRNKGGVGREGFPKQMAIDWVHVWQCAGDPASTAHCETSGD